ncbi:MAG TPA: hypothetical protein DD614_04370 [Clostridiales bacterium]|nr:hypothetical protein [Clostridiales bacterium]
MANFSDYNWNKENNEQKLSEQDLEKLIDKYSELDNDTLMKEFLNITLEKKKQGKLSDSELSVLKNSILPYLNESQKQSLNSILEIVKNV